MKGQEQEDWRNPPPAARARSIRDISFDKFDALSTSRCSPRGYAISFVSRGNDISIVPDYNNSQKTWANVLQKHAGRFTRQREGGRRHIGDGNGGIAAGRDDVENLLTQ